MPDQFLNSFMDQCWEDLLLLHWPVEGELVRKSIPDDLKVDLFEGQAWMSVVGFQLTGLKISPFRWLTWPDFWEINLRTYVRDRHGNKGIWFYSLDSSDPLAVSVLDYFTVCLITMPIRRVGYIGIKFPFFPVEIPPTPRLMPNSKRHFNRLKRIYMPIPSSIIFYWKDIDFGRVGKFLILLFLHRLNINPIKRF